MAKHCTHTFRRIISTHNWKNQPYTRTYFLCCKCCGHRWKVYYDTKKNKEVPLPPRYKWLSTDDVHFILTDPRPGTEIAKILKVTHQTISQVRTGQSHKHLFPELPRSNSSRRSKLVGKDGKSCRNCKHWWRGSCGLDIPEAGGAFASDCSYLEE